DLVIQTGWRAQSSGAIVTPEDTNLGLFSSTQRGGGDAVAAIVLHFVIGGGVLLTGQLGRRWDLYLIGVANGKGSNISPFGADGHLAGVQWIRPPSAQFGIQVIVHRLIGTI